MLQKIISVSNSVDLLLNFCVRIVNAVALIGHCCDGFVSRMATYAWRNCFRTSGGLGIPGTVVPERKHSSKRMKIMNLAYLMMVVG